MKLTVGICEDDSFTRSTLAASLAHRDVAVLFASDSPAAALRDFVEHQPHAMLIDLHLGAGPTGLDLSREIRAKVPETGIVFVTSFESPKMLDQGFLGVPSGSQYLIKSEISSVEEVLQALQRSVAANRKTQLPLRSAMDSLTPHQLNVLKLVAEGLTNAEIANQLGIEPKSVEGVISRVHERLGLDKGQGLNQRIQMAVTYLRSIGWHRGG